MARTVQEFTALLDRFGESLNNLQPQLQELADQVVTDLKAGIRAQGLVKTQALVNSVSALATSNTLDISMLDYGMYNNYGVKGESGVKEGTVRKVEFGVLPRPRSGAFYSFRAREYGIRSRQFFTMEGLNAQIAEEIEIKITGTFN